MATLRCKEPFSADIKGVPRVVPAGQLLDSDDPIVKGREHLFEPVESFMASRATPAPDTMAAVETATAAPGEKRSVSRKKAD